MLDCTHIHVVHGFLCPGKRLQQGPNPFERTLNDVNWGPEPTQKSVKCDVVTVSSSVKLKPTESDHADYTRNVVCL